MKGNVGNVGKHLLVFLVAIISVEVLEMVVVMACGMFCNSYGR